MTIKITTSIYRYWGKLNLQNVFKNIFSACSKSLLHEFSNQYFILLILILNDQNCFKFKINPVYSKMTYIVIL